jgi:hypothetical protein
MIYPGYLLNPGDMFQVNPEWVMYATGAQKEGTQARSGRVTRRRKLAAAQKAAEEQDAASTQEVESAVDKEAASGDESTSTETIKSSVSSPSEGETRETAKEEETEEQIKEKEAEAKETLKRILGQAKSILSSSKDSLPAKRKQDFREFQREVRRVLSRSSSKTILTDDLEAQFLEMKNQLLIKERPSTDEAKHDSSSKSPKPSTLSRGNDKSAKPALEDSQIISEAFDASALSAFELRQLKEALAELRENPIDPSKPFATPWRPRDYMSPFAFIPRFLEVHPTICAAVYLKHPVAKPGLAEVPTPFAEHTNGLAFNWYLRRR